MLIIVWIVSHVCDINSKFSLLSVSSARCPHILLFSVFLHAVRYDFLFIIPKWKYTSNKFLNCCTSLLPTHPLTSFFLSSVLSRSHLRHLRFSIVNFSFICSVRNGSIAITLYLLYIICISVTASAYFPPHLIIVHTQTILKCRWAPEMCATRKSSISQCTPYVYGYVYVLVLSLANFHTKFSFSSDAHKCNVYQPMGNKRNPMQMLYSHYY